MKPHAGGEIEGTDIHLGLIRLYILHCAALEPVFSLGMLEKLDRHRLKLNVGSISQILRGLERKGYLVSASAVNGSRSQKSYRITSRGRSVVKEARKKVRELLARLPASI